MNVGHVRNADDCAVGSFLYRNVLERFRVENAAQRTDGKSRLAPFDRTRRQFQVALLERSRHLGTGYAQCLQTHRINPQANRRTLFAPDGDFRHAIDCLQAFLHKVIRDFGNFHRVELVAHEAHHQNRVVIAVGLVNRRFIDIIRQATAHATHTVTDFIRSRFQVHARFKFNVDERESVAARRSKRLDTGSTVDGRFQNFSDFGFHHRGIGTGVRCTHLDQGIVYVRVLTHTQVGGSERTEQDDDERHHRHEYRAAYGKVSNTHRSPTPLRNRHCDGFRGYARQRPRASLSGPR